MEGRISSISLTVTEIAGLKSEAVRGRPYAARISVPLAMRLLDGTDRYFDPFAVLDELDYLEGVRLASRTKPESRFKGVHLQPFWHKHFSSSRHLLKNIGVRWNFEGGGNKDLDQMILDVAQKYGEDPDQWINHLVHRLVVSGYEERAARGLTGDWIIFAKHAGANYYLDLATHDEGSAEQAEQLAGKLRSGCFAEFPFLFR
ncbi:hypothetical protein [Burkholderia ubonensis]|uniref:hypothetical protein n=1 Tax=Burkholderia ubonensis TaxID=101571 RepID=UPI000B178605|nr:hypothetical protein [Burkholderia ubonensis]